MFNFFVFFMPIPTFSIFPFNNGFCPISIYVKHAYSFLAKDVIFVLLLLLSQFKLNLIPYSTVSYLSVLFSPIFFFLYPKPWMRKVRASSRHLLDEIRAIHGKWYTSSFFRNKPFLFVKIESWKFQHFFDSLFCEPSQNFS